VKKQKTLDNTREADETVVQADDAEVLADESLDEFSSYFHGEVEPKILVTSCYRPSKVMYDFIRDLLYVFPNSFYYKRAKFTIKQITEAAKKRGYTDLIIINEDRKMFNALTHVHLPEGPTAYYKLSNVVLCKDIEGECDKRAWPRTHVRGGCHSRPSELTPAPCSRFSLLSRSRSHDVAPARGDPQQLQHSLGPSRRSHAR
jgi:hypothetical protein